MLETSFLLSFIGFFIVLTPLVFVHEFGHYYAAIKSGVTVETFSIGFGPELFGFNDKKNTRWKFSLIPLGGYVKMKGELFSSLDNSNNISLTKDTFTEATLLSRFIIVASGPLANLIFGLLLITSLYTFNGKYVSTSIIDTVIDTKPANVAGILPGDKIISINDELVENFQEIKFIVENNPNISMQFKILRNDTVLFLNVVPEEFFDERSKSTVGRIGITAKPMVLTKLTLIEAFKVGLYDTIKLTIEWIKGLKTLLTFNIDKKDIMGPVGIAKISGSSLNQGFFSIIFLMAVLSINLGLINLLPIPALDGGYIVLQIYEFVFKKPLPSQIQIFLLKFGFVFLLMLMFIITAFDLGF